MDGSALPDIPLSNIEFRITDATDVDAEGRFWAINYNFYVAGNRIPIDPLFESYGYGPTHAESYVVERLVAFDITSSGIVLADQPPIQLKLIEAARNWEGIVQLDDNGFLIATDKFPDTMLGFVPLPQGSR
jgi:hypothetical protein